MNPDNDSVHGRDHTDVDWQVMADQLENSGELHLPVLRRTAARLSELLDPEKEVRRILDIGSGPGVMTCVLAGTSRLQTRLDAAQESWFEIMRAELPDSTTLVEHWPALLSRAGLTGVASFASLLDLPAPLGEPARAFLHTHLTRLRERASEFLNAQDHKTLDVLLDSGAPEGILRRPDAFLLSATTVFTGLSPAR